MGAHRNSETPRLVAFGRRAALCGLFLAASSGECLATSSAELAAARRLFHEAVRLEQDSRWELAASKLRDALAVKETPGLRFHLAHCQEQLGQLVEALANYDQAQELIAAGATAPDVQALLEPARSKLETRMPSLLLVAPAGIEQLEVELNSKAVPSSLIGRPVPMNPAKYRVLARAPGYREFDQEVLVIEGERRTVQIDMVRLPESPALTQRQSRVASSEQHASNWTDTTKTYVLAAESAFAVTALGVGIGFWMAQNDADDRIDRIQATLAPGACSAQSAVGTPRSQACAELAETIEKHNFARRLSGAGFISAGVGAVATALTYALWPSTPVAPRVYRSASGTWLGIGGRF